MEFICANKVIGESYSFTLSGLIPVPAHVDTAKPLAQNTVAICEMLIRSRRQANRREIYVKSLARYLRRFTDHHPDISTVSSVDIEVFIGQFPNPSSRAKWLSVLDTLFNYAVKHEFIAKNPCNKIDRITIDRKEPVTLTLEQAKSLMEHCPNYMLPWLALGMFQGVRPHEILRIKWNDINLETQTAKIDGKTRRRRIVRLEPVTVEILQHCQQGIGNLAPSKSTVRRWMRRVRCLIGGRWTIDVLRHTAASMLLAKYQDAPKVALSLGNSASILLTHYNNPVTHEQAEKFFALRPDIVGQLAKAA